MLNLSVAELEQRQAVLDEVSEERTFQDSKWGGPEHDDKHSPNQWLQFIADRAMYQVYALDHAESDAEENNPYKNDYRASLVKMAALAVAGIQAFDRNKAKEIGGDLTTPIQPGHVAFFANGKDAEMGIAVLHVDGWKIHPVDALPAGVEPPILAPKNNGLRWSDTFSGS